MIIDNSAANTFRECPLKYYYSYLAEGTGLELQPYKGEVAPIDLGSRVHELLEEYYRELKGEPRGVYVASNNERLELEAQMIMVAYRAKYPQEDFDIVDVERTFKVQLPNICPRCYKGVGFEKLDAHPHVVCSECGKMFLPSRHIYAGKIDLTFRSRETGKLCIMDHKTEKRQSQSNKPQKWAARDQASLYLWAASKIYNEPIGNFYVNVLKRPSDKLQEGPVFPDRQRLEREQGQLDLAVRDLVIIADEIERYKNIFGEDLWPSNREMCTNYGECSFYLPDTFGWSEAIRREKYQAKTPYLKIEGLDVIQ